MKASIPRLPHPVRWLLLVASAGAVLAADNSWMSTLKLDFASASQWFSSEPVFNLPSADTAMSASGPYRSAPQLSMGHLINGLLFSRPSRTWTLTPAAPEIASAWMTQQTGAAVTDGTTPYAPMEFGTSSFVSSPGSTSALLPAAPAAAIGFWSSSSSGNWSSIGNWAAFAIPDGASSIAHLDSHPLNISIIVTLDTSRTVGQLFIGDSTSAHSYTLAASGGSSLTFDNNGATGLLNQTATSFGDNVSAPIIIGNVNYLSVRNDSTTKPFTLSGDISAGGPAKIIQFDGGVVNVTGVLSNGGAGNSLQVGIAGGVVTLTGANTYTGFTTVLNGATGLINGNNSGATGNVSVVNSGTLGGTGTIGGSVSVGNGIITGGTATDTGTLHIGTLTLNQNVSFNGGLESTSTYLANIIGNVSDTLAIMGNLNISGSSHLDLVGSADGFTVYTLATYLGRSGQFSVVDNMPANYSLVYGDNDLLLVPTAIPEPATWIGGALALGALAVAARRRSRRVKG